MVYLIFTSRELVYNLIFYFPSTHCIYDGKEKKPEQPGFARLPSDNVAFERVDLIKQLSDKKIKKKYTIKKETTG